MKLPIIKLLSFLFVAMFFFSMPYMAYADAPGFTGRVVTSSTGAPLAGVWVKQVDSHWHITFPRGQHRFARTDNNGNFTFGSHHNDFTAAQVDTLGRTPVDTNLDGINDDFMVVIRTPNPPEHEWWMAFDCGTNPHSFSLVIPAGWSGSASQVTSVSVNNVTGMDVVGDIFYTGTVPIYSIAGNVYEDTNRNGVKNPGERNYQGATITRTGTTGGTDVSAANGDYAFTGVNQGNYTVSIAVPPGYQATSAQSVATSLGPNRTINFGIVQPFSITGNVFNDRNANGVKDTGEPNFPGATITRSGASSGTGTSDASGNYTFANISAGNYTVALTTPPGYRITTPASQSFTVGPSRTVNFGVSQLYTVTGNVYLDTNANGFKDIGEANYAGTPALSASRGTVVANASATYTVSNVTAGALTVSYTSLPIGHYISYPRNGPPPSFLVTVGPSCSTNGANGAVCALNISNLNFGINNSLPWVQTVCGDFRNDAGITNPVPAGQSALTTNASCSGPGIVFTGSGTPSFVPGNASSTNQVVGGTIYPEVYVPPGAGGIVTSYTYLNAKAQATDTAPINLSTVCTVSNCTLPANLPQGIYRANSDVTLNASTFLPNRHYVFLVNGNLTIRGNVITPVSASSVFAVSGNIIIPASVGNPVATTTPNLSGIFSTDRSFIMQSNNNCTDLRINLEGTLIVNAARTGGSLQNARNLCASNATTPTLQMTQRLDFVLNLPNFVRLQENTLEEGAP